MSGNRALYYGAYGSFPILTCFIGTCNSSHMWIGPGI